MTIEDYINDYYEAKRKEEEQNKQQANGNFTENEVMDKLEQIDQSFADELESIKIPSGVEDLPELPKYEYLEYDAPDDDTIKSQAEDSLQSYKDTTIAGIEEEAQAGKEAVEKDKAEAVIKAEQTAKDIESAYAGAIKSANDDTLKRGLARSSIAVNQNTALQSDKANALSQAASEAQAEQNRLNSEITALENERIKALNSFNIAYAAKVTEKISELTAERDKRIAEVTEYNNSLREQEKKDAEERAELILELQKQAMENNSDETNKLVQNAYDKMYTAKYSILRSYLGGMSKDKAKEIMTQNSFVRDQLSDEYYYKLYNEFVF